MPPELIQVWCRQLHHGRARNRRRTPKYDARDAALNALVTVDMRLDLISVAPQALHAPHNPSITPRTSPTPSEAPRHSKANAFARAEAFAPKGRPTLRSPSGQIGSQRLAEA